MLGQIYEMTYGQYYYIGKHDGDIFIDEYFGSGIAWTNVVKKYGKENIQRKILTTYETKEQADELEKFYIKQYKEKYGKKCLNIADGGQGGNLGEEVNKKISQAVSGEGNGMYGKKLSKEALDKISAKLKGHPNYNHSNYRPTEEIKEKISKSHIGIKQTPESIAKIKEARAKQTNLKLDSAKGKHWYTDGINNIMCFEQDKPNNYYLGRTIIKRSKNNMKLVAKEINDPRVLFSTMGCRTCQFTDVNFDESYKKTLNRVLKGEKINPLDVQHISSNQKDSRGNICPVTIIMPTLAMKAKEIMDNATEDYPASLTETFLGLLDIKINEAKDMLIERFEWICNQNPESAKFMYENGTMAGYVPEEGIRSALKHGTLALGQLGLAETLQILIGCDHTTEKGMELAKQIEGLFKKRCAEFKEQYQLNFGVYYTPAENLCYTAMKKFKAKYGEIPNVSDREFFTNSMHVPVWKEVDPFEKIDIESQLTGYSSAGCITYVELEATAKHNVEALETLVNYAMDKDIPYFALNVPNDTCMECGYCDEINDVCPVCGSTKIMQLRRVTGYLSTDYRNFNYGKQKEVETRQKHSAATWRG